MAEHPGQHGYPWDGKSKWKKSASHHFEQESDYSGHYKHDKESHHWHESASDPHGVYKHFDDSPAAYPTPAYIPYGVPKAVKKKVHVSGHYVAAHTPAHAPVSHKTHCPPIVCDPQYVIRDRYVPREVPVVHPVVTVNRHIIVNVPKHYYQPMTKHVVVDPGCPGTHCKPCGHHG